MKKYLLVLVMPLVILMDYALWNMLMSSSFGDATLSKCVEDNLKQIIKL